MTENKGDLISREALKEIIIKICGKCSNNITEYDENNIPDGNCAIWHILNMIDNAPTVDLKDIYQEGHYDGHLEGYTKALNEERPQGKCEKCTYRIFTEKFTDSISEVMALYGITSVEELQERLQAEMRGKADQLRDCENCIHHSDNGCEVWDCEFEKRSDL